MLSATYRYSDTRYSDTHYSDTRYSDNVTVQDIKTLPPPNPNPNRNSNPGVGITGVGIMGVGITGASRCYYRQLIYCVRVQLGLTKSESEVSSAGDQRTSETDELEHFGGEINCTVTNHVPSEGCNSSEAHSPPNTPAASGFSFRIHSSTDLPSLIDHCLTDSMPTEIGIMNSSGQVESGDDRMSTPPLRPDSDNDASLPGMTNSLMHVESAGDTDFHSALSTLPLRPDLDYDSSLPIGDVFPDKIDKPIVSRAPCTEPLQLNSLFDDYGKMVNNSSVGDSDATSKQLVRDVNSLLRLGEGDSSEIKDEVKNCEETRCPKPDDAGCFNNDMALADVIDHLEDATSIAGTCEVTGEPALTAKSGLSDDLGQKGNAISPKEPVSFCLQECSTEPHFGQDKELANPSLCVAQCVGKMASEYNSELSTGDSAAKDINGSCDMGRKTPTTEYIESIVSEVLHNSSKTDADFAMNSSAPAHSDESTAHSLSDGELNVVTDITESGPVDIRWPRLSDDISKSEDTATDQSDGCKPFPSIIISETTRPTTPDSFVSTTSVQNPDGNGGLGLVRSTVAGDLVMPCMASFSSSSSDGWPSFDESWLPDWKLQINAVVRLKRLSLPIDQYFPSSECSTSKESKDLGGKQPEQSSFPSKLEPSSVQPLLLKMLPEEAQTETKGAATELAVKDEFSMPERSALPAAVEDVLAKHLEQAKHVNEPTSASVTSVTSSLVSSSDAMQPSTVVASDPVRQKRFGYADYCNDRRFQPVVRLVRLPLEFFHMLQQTSRPAASSSSSSISISDLPKRFVTLRQH